LTLAPAAVDGEEGCFEEGMIVKYLAEVPPS